MLRPTLLAAVLAAMSFAASGRAAESVDRVLALQNSLANARDLLTSNKSAEAIELLEKQLPFVDGNRVFLDMLRSAYAAEVKKLQLTNGDAKAIADLRTKLALLGGRAEEPAPVPAGTDPLRDAAVLFNQAKAEPQKFDLAAQMFASAFASKVEMSPEQLAAWAYCRVRVAADKLNQPGADPRLADEVEDALRLAPNNAELQKVGREVIAAARLKTESKPGQASPDGWDVVESESFRVRHHGQRAIAETIAKTADAKRTEIFSRWSGPPGGAWNPKCEITLHTDGSAFAAATQQPAAATGRALVNLDNGRAVARKLDLRADDETVADVALPRELSHVVLADLFPSQAPPRWAVEGMAVLAASPAEVERYLRTAQRCRRDGELLPVSSLLEAATPPVDRATGYAVGSVSLVEFLVRWKGDKAFTTFLRDSQRYGTASALKRQYGVDDTKHLEEVWTSSAGSVRGQGQ